MEKIYLTDDIYVASVLKLCGFKLVTVSKTGDRGTFHFADRDDRSQIVQDYFSGDLTGSLKQFASTWGDLKSLVTQME